MERSKICFISGNWLKIIAAVSMLIDHMGFMLFPKILIFRIIGRLAFPIFAFMIAEGCRYTRNKLRHFLTIAVFATVIQIVYGIATTSSIMSVFVTFSLSMLIIYAFQYFKSNLFDVECSSFKKALSGILLFVVIGVIYVICKYVKIDYGIYGVLMPVAASVFHSPKDVKSDVMKRLDCIPVHVMTMGVCLAYFSVVRGWVQGYSLLALPLLLLYSGKRGKIKMKYFFYIFYPLHIVVLEGIRWLIDNK